RDAAIARRAPGDSRTRARPAATATTSSSVRSRPVSRMILIAADSKRQRGVAAATGPRCGTLVVGSLRCFSDGRGGVSVRVVAVLGGQWGDEGKGKVVDLLADRFEIVARYHGGQNAGHTAKLGSQHFALHPL